MALAALVLAFAVYYTYLNATGSCAVPGCPHFAHAPLSTELPAGILGAMLALAGVTLGGRLRRRCSSDRKPSELYLSPEPEPPQPWKAHPRRRY